ncbi:hypothetical protein ACTXT7_009471, partial [Hymenolepis weldensis]
KNVFIKSYLSALPRIVVISTATDTTTQKGSSDGINLLTKIPYVTEIPSPAKIFHNFFCSRPKTTS